MEGAPTANLFHAKPPKKAAPIAFHISVHARTYSGPLLAQVMAMNNPNEKRRRSDLLDLPEEMVQNVTDRIADRLWHSCACSTNSMKV